MPTYRNQWPIYAKQWDAMVIASSRQAEFNSITQHLLSRKDLYLQAELATGVPWFMIAVIDERESGARGGVLHNGDMIVGTGRKTYHVPKGRGPFATWLDAAIDALKYDGLTSIIDWRVEKIIYYLEKYNGWGYQGHGVPSAYVWSGSNIYKKGKYIADGVWRANTVDIQVGCAPLMSTMAAFDKSIRFTRED